MQKNTTLERLFKCISDSTSENEAAERFLAPQKGRPIKNLDGELKQLISDHYGKENWKSVINTANIILKSLKKVDSPPRFKKKEEEAIAVKVSGGYKITKGNKEWSYSDKQVEFFKTVVDLVNKAK